MGSPTNASATVDYEEIERKSEIKLEHEAYGISSSTEAANKAANDTQNQVSRKKMEEVRNLQSVNTDDFAGHLAKAGTQIKVMNQILNRLVPSDDSHTFILERQYTEIEVIQGNLITF